jgi:acetate kinase
MREVLDRAQAGDGEAELALAVYMHVLIGAIAAMAAAMEGLDVLAFTRGRRRASAPIRAQAAQRLRWIGVAVDDERNRVADRGPDISAAEASVRTVVLHACEEFEMARQTQALLGPAPGGPGR